MSAEFLSDAPMRRIRRGYLQPSLATGVDGDSKRKSALRCGCVWLRLDGWSRGVADGSGSGVFVKGAAVATSGRARYPCAVALSFADPASAGAYANQTVEPCKEQQMAIAAVIVAVVLSVVLVLIAISQIPA
jgi:hypothetical protein